MHALPLRLTAGLLLAAALVLAGCGDDPAPPTTKTSTPTEEPTKTSPRRRHPADNMSGSPDGASVIAEDLGPLPEPGAAGAGVANTLQAFHKRMEQLVAACRAEGAKAESDARDLLLLDSKAWFEEVFGADHERLGALVKEYEGRAAQLAGLPTAIRARLKEGQTEAQTELFIDADDELATGFQALALRSMRTPIALYSLRLMEEDADGGWHLWSFVHVDGQFRFVGQMTALTPAAADELLRDLGSRRIKDANKIRAGWKKR